MTPASINFEDLEFDKLSLKMFDPALEKKYNIFRIHYFLKIVPRVLYIFCSVFALYSAVDYLLDRNVRYLISHICVLAFCIAIILFSKTHCFKVKFYFFVRCIFLIVISSNFLYYMLSDESHFTYQFIMLIIILTYNLNMGIFFSIFANFLNMMFFFIKWFYIIFLIISTSF